MNVELLVNIRRLRIFKLRWELLSQVRLTISDYNSETFNVSRVGRTKGKGSSLSRADRANTYGANHTSTTVEVT